MVYKGVPALQKGFFRAQFSMSELVKWETRLHLKSSLISSYSSSLKAFLLHSKDAWKTLIKVWVDFLTVHHHGIEKKLPLCWFWEKFWTGYFQREVQTN